MVRPTQDHSSGTEQPTPFKHGRSSSSDQPKNQVIARSIEFDPSLPPTSPSRSKITRSDNKRRKSSTSSGSKHKSRPAYSRKYSTPPSRPLSPAGFPKHLDLDMAIPDIDLNVSTSLNVADHLTSINHRLNTYTASVSMQPHFQVEVDTAPQEPDIWSDPETDYFSSIEGSGPKHGRGKSRRQISQAMNNIGSLNALMVGGNVNGLQQINEGNESDFPLSGMPGAFAG